jgi:hypothetical protein
VVTKGGSPPGVKATRRHILASGTPYQSISNFSMTSVSASAALVHS